MSTGSREQSMPTKALRRMTGVRPMIETFPLERAGRTYARLLSGKAQFRVLLTNKN